MDPAFHELFQSLGFLLGTFWLYRWIKIRHQDWMRELRAFRTLDVDFKNERPHLDVKVVTDPRLGRLGYGSIWCGHPGANHRCTLCNLNRQNRVEPVIPPPPPIPSTGPGPTEPVIPPPPPTSIPGPGRSC